MEFTAQLLKLYPEYNTVYGPYKRSDGRKHLILFQKGQKTCRLTLSYPKALLEVQAKRRLTQNETADHIDENFENNSLDNLQILSREDNIRKSTHTEIYSFICPICKKEATKPMRQVRNNQGKKKKFGPFCSRSCAGKIYLLQLKEFKEKMLSLNNPQVLDGLK